MLASRQPHAVKDIAVVNAMHPADLLVPNQAVQNDVLSTADRRVSLRAGMLGSSRYSKPLRDRTTLFTCCYANAVEEPIASKLRPELLHDRIPT